jgi:hypothetical protein
MKAKLDFIQNALKDLHYPKETDSIFFGDSSPFPVADTQLLFNFDGICHSQTK